MKSKKATRRALLSSALSLVLCFSMLLGTTFAWFTDEAKTGVNTIQAGTLDIKLMGQAGDGTYSYDLEGKDFQFKNIKKETNILWEPGVTFMTDGFQIQNHGTLWLKYQMVINGVTDGNAKLLEAIDFYMTTIKPEDDDTAATYMTAVEAGKADGKTFALNDFVSKFRVLAPAGETAATIGNDGTTYDDYDGTYYLVGHMKEEANNDYQGLSIEGVGITVYATQMEAEFDSFDNTYDAAAAVSVNTVDALKAAIAAADDGSIVFVEPGVYDLSSGPIVIEGKTVSIIGVGNVTINKNYGNTHIFTVKNGANVTFENLHMDGKGNTREGIYVRWDSDVTLKNCTIKNTGGKDILIDEASDAAHGEETASRVSLINTDIEDVAMCASPATSVPKATQDTYVYFNYDRNSTVGSIEKQTPNLKPENIIINGVDDGGIAITLYVSNDAELAAALNSIQTENKYWNKNVIVSMAAGEYSADHVINQYPEWNGIPGRGTGNNYQGGVPAGAPLANVTFVGETASTYSLRGAQAVPAVTFTGNVTVNGFADSMAGLTSAVAVTTFQNIAFDAANSMEENGEDSIVMYVTAAASNVNFEGCVFTNATHVNLGGSSPNGIGNVSFTGCTFDNGGCLSGYPQNLTVTDCVVENADNGFINIQSGGDITVENCAINAGKYFIRTKSTGTELVVKNSDITMYESEGTKHLVYFRGSNESAEFIDCTIADGWTTEGVDANSTLEVINYSETDDGLKLYTDGVTGDVVLYNASAITGADAVIPEGVTVIGSKVFNKMSNIETVSLPSTLKAVENGAFMGTSLKSVSIPGSVSLNERADGKSHAHTFAECYSLSNVTIGEGVTAIPSGCFVSCTSLEEVVIPASVTSLGKKAFYDCLSLKTVYLLSADCTIGAQAFGANQQGFQEMTIYVPNATVKAAVEATLTDNNKNSVSVVVMDSAPTVNGTTYAYNNDQLSTAISGGAETVYLSTGEYTMPSTSADVTITGTKDTEVELPSNAVSGNGNVITFDGITVIGETDSSWYSTLFNGAEKVVYKNCDIYNQLTTYCDSEFINCNFYNTFENDYSVYCYSGSTIKFDGCSFDTKCSKAIKVYDEGNGGRKVYVNDCSFTTETDNKAAVEIDSTYSVYYIYFTGENTLSGAYTKLWNSDPGEDLGTNVYINGVKQ